MSCKPNLDIRKRKKEKRLQLNKKALIYQNGKLALKRNKIHLARVIFMDLYGQYPEDNEIVQKYVLTLRKQRLLEDAISVLEDQSELTPLSFRELARLYIRTENYDKAYQLCQGLTEEDISSIKLAGLNSYYRQLKIFLHRFYPDVSLPLEISGHFENALLHYDENLALCHIRIRHDYYSRTRYSLRGTLFSKDINVDNLFKNVQNSLSLEHRETLEQGFLDSYLYRCESDEFNCLRVLTIPNTYNIITMYPLKVNSMEEVKKLRPFQNQGNIFMKNKKFK